MKVHDQVHMTGMNCGPMLQWVTVKLSNTDINNIKSAQAIIDNNEFIVNINMVFDGEYVLSSDLGIWESPTLTVNKFTTCFELFDEDMDRNLWIDLQVDSPKNVYLKDLAINL